MRCRRQRSNHGSKMGFFCLFQTELGVNLKKFRVFCLFQTSLGFDLKKGRGFFVCFKRVRILGARICQ